MLWLKILHIFDFGTVNEKMKTGELLIQDLVDLKLLLIYIILENHINGAGANTLAIIKIYEIY